MAVKERDRAQQPPQPPPPQPKRTFKFPTAFTVLGAILLLVCIFIGISAATS
jgi:hypothetical protein